MALSAFADRRLPPDDIALARVLGPARPAWTALHDALRARIVPSSTTWAFTSRATGWGMRVLQGDRVVVYMTPNTGSFLVSFVLGARAVEAALASELPPAAKSAIASARTYAEGRGVRFQVHDPADVPWLLTLAALKLGQAAS